MEQFEQAFIEWTISKLRQAHQPVSQMIMNLRKSNPELAQYAEKIASRITGSKEPKYRAAFQEALVKAIETADDPQQAAKDFFAAIKLSPDNEKTIREMIKTIY